MPLSHGKSAKAFSHNVETEMHHGKPLKQSLAISYAMKRKKKAHGGYCDEGCEMLHEHNYAKGGDVKGVHEPKSALFFEDDSAGETAHEARGLSHAGILVRQGRQYPKKEEQERGYYADAKKSHKKVLGEMKRLKHKDRKYLAEGGEIDLHDEPESEISKSMKKAFKTPMAHGGRVSGHDVDKAEEKNYDYVEYGHHTPSHKQYEHRGLASGTSGKSLAGEYVEKGEYGKAKSRHKDILGKMHEMKGKDRKYLAEGGEVMPCVNCGHVAEHETENQHASTEDEMHDDMIEHIMKKRKGYSEGGKVSNEDEPIADSEPAEYDDLEKDDDLEFHYTGKNSGDEEGNEHEEEEDEDVVSQIMKSRKKKDKMPRPA